MSSNIYELVLMFVLAYLLGSIPSGVWIGKSFFHIDIRKHGSGNIGTTNTFRVLGPFAGTVVMIMDISKGALATLLPVFFNNQTINPLFFGLAAIIGHTFSIFDRFKGGKAVATSAGMLFAYRPDFFFLAFAIWIGLIFLTSIVSVASIIGFIAITIAVYFTHDMLLFLFAIVLTCFIIYRHRQNIARLFRGKENMVHFGLGYWLTNKK